jgi:hypothetical protein
MPEPINKKLYEKVKKLANKKFSSKTGIYKSSWIVKKYKELGGKYKGKSSSKSGLKRWYAEKWVDLNRKSKNGKYASCGRRSSKTGKYPVCRPSKRITSKTPRTFKEISKKSLKKAKQLKAKLRSRGNVQFGAGKNDKLEPNVFLPIVFIGILFMSFVN